MPAKIMLVEDDTNLSDIYKARFEAEGFQVTAAKDGEEALALAVKEKPDLIISDIMMPKISGFDMLDILRSTESIKYTKVVMMTALGQTEDKARAEKLGADRYLVKSQVTLEDVVRTVHEVLGDGSTPAAATAAPVGSNQEAPVSSPITDSLSTAPVNTATPANPSAPAEPTTTKVTVSTPTDNTQPPKAAPAAAVPSANPVAQDPATSEAATPPIQVPTSAQLAAAEPTVAPVVPMSKPAASLGSSDSKAAALSQIQDFVNQEEARSQAKADKANAAMEAEKAKSISESPAAAVSPPSSQPAAASTAEGSATDHVSIANKKIITPVNNGKPKFDLEKALASEDGKTQTSLASPDATSPPSLTPLSPPEPSGNPGIAPVGNNTL